MQLDKCIPARKWDTTLRGYERGNAPVRFRGRNDIGIGQHEKVRQGGIGTARKERNSY